MVKEDKKLIKIEPIKIESPSTSQKLSSEEVIKEKPVDILSKLKVATKVSTEGIVPSKEEVSNKVLESLKETIAKQEIDEPITVQPIVKKVLTKRVIKKRVITKKVKVTTKKKIIKPAKITKKVNVIKNAKVIKKQPSRVSIPNIKLVKAQTIQRGDSTLTREEEVALYHKKYDSDLEVVSVSKPFVIKEKKNIPDSHYFEPQKPVETTTNTNPTKFVKTLGVVALSNAYETSLVVPEKIEVAKEGIVELPNAKLETEDMKKLKFVKPLEVVEVSKPFETIEADKYLK